MLRVWGPRLAGGGSLAKVGAWRCCWGSLKPGYRPVSALGARKLDFPSGRRDLEQVTSHPRVVLGVGGDATRENPSQPQTLHRDRGFSSGKEPGVGNGGVGCDWGGSSRESKNLS